MPAIAETILNAATVLVPVTVLTTATLAASANPIVYRKGAKQILFLRNATAGTLSPRATGAGATTAQTYGAGVKDISGGVAPAACLAANWEIIDLDAHFAYLAGAIDITSGLNMVGSLIARHNP